jgi:SAM-dependent methyltransferase
MLDRDHWIEVMKGVTAGHAPEATSAVNASIDEAKELFSHNMIRNGIRVLDVGSGNGRQAIGMMQYDIEEYVGIEIVKSCVEFSQNAFSPYPNYKFIWMNIRNDDSNPKGTLEASEFRIPFEDGHFDSVIAGSLFTHLSTPEICAHYLSEMNRVLNKDGGLFSSWFRNPPNEASSSPSRTVLLESTIISMICHHFEIYHTRGGITPGYHDQWCIFSKKAAKQSI